LQLSSSPLHVSVAATAHVLHVHNGPHVCTPVHPPGALQLDDEPRTQMNPSSVEPSQSSSAALHASVAPGNAEALPSLQSVPPHAPSP
jgi:hypothetical protein